MLGKDFEDFLRWDNNALGRPMCLIVKACNGSPLDSLGMVLYDIMDDGTLKPVFPVPRFYSSTLIGF